ncbi:MAG: hypothetical protein JW934_05250 [Anaerolineae bacterium]|nr:hypothetical protein [Anaerolineae bacterium]
METTTVCGLPLFFEAVERETADLVGEAIGKSVHLLKENWNLDAPQDCQVYVMTSWQQFMFQAAPWPWRIWMRLTWPLWAGRAQKLWAIAGGFHQPFGRRRAVGVKPYRLVQQADSSIGRRIFVASEYESPQRKVQHVTCHELTHAFTAHLKPPMWLNEGLAMRAVDLFAGAPTVRTETIEILARAAVEIDSSRYRQIDPNDPETILYHAVRGYWLTQFLQAQHPDLLKRLLARRYDRPTLDREIANAVGLDALTLWQRIDGIVVDHFSQV